MGGPISSGPIPPCAYTNTGAASTQAKTTRLMRHNAIKLERNKSLRGAAGDESNLRVIDR